MFESLIGFLSVNKIDNDNRGGEKENKKKEKGRRGEDNSIELQKPNVKARFITTIKKHN